MKLNGKLAVLKVRYQSIFHIICHLINASLCSCCTYWQALWNSLWIFFQNIFNHILDCWQYHLWTNGVWFSFPCLWSVILYKVFSPTLSASAGALKNVFKLWWFWIFLSTFWNKQDFCFSYQSESCQDDPLSLLAPWQHYWKSSHIESTFTNNLVNIVCTFFSKLFFHWFCNSKYMYEYSVHISCICSLSKRWVDHFTSRSCNAHVLANYMGLAFNIVMSYIHVEV